ncbi:hypothetical protein LMG23992_02486 [Cupriavidus laharis]|uniref:Type VI secretion system tip protein VgrG n=1 Tax=Cupriavidus laharis TaxID=151654 RepID=A0ABM8X147_9BURK|nr:type VI secretion system Vgr family protein [Cupriavidus laharis]CAG9173562.1 hypothetical protein LMG23992_02486 [Cupriavidus laharis]
MAEGWGDPAALVTGRQAYFLDVTGAPSASGLSVVSFRAVERLGEPYEVTVQLTHPLELDRAEYLTRPAAFVIQTADGSEPRRFAGRITGFAKTRQTRDFCAYEIVVQPEVGLLGLTRRSRIYQQKAAPQIIEAILRSHDLRGHQFAFKTRRQYRVHPFRLQYQMSDWDYIRLLMEQEGLYSYSVPGKFGEMIVFGDDIDHYIYQPELRVPYRETAGLEAGIEAVFALQTRSKTVPESFLAADYNPDNAYERFKAEANIARKDRTTYGQPYVYGTHHLDQDSAKWEAQLRHEAAIAGQVVYEGESNVLELRPARILRMDVTLSDAPNGQVITEVIHSGARDQAYRNTYKAIPSDRRFRLPMDEAKWPRIAGTLSGRITSPGQYKYAYLTQDGHYIVRFDLDFDAWPKGGESVPLRLAKPFAGGLQTGFHFPLIDGTEVAIAFHDGNPNRPYIAHAMHNSWQDDLITNQDRWLSRNVIRTQSNNKLRMEDWEGQESIKLSTEYGGRTQLNLGYLVDGKKKRRGDGFELRTGGHGALRSGRGLLFTAWAQPANAPQLDMVAAMNTVRAVLSQAQALANAASQSKAEMADLKAENEWLRSSVNELKQAVVLLTAPNGIAMATPDRVSVAAGRDVNVATKSAFHVSAMANVAIAAGKALSLFASQFGIKLFAAKGKVEIQAQSDALELFADKQLHIASANADVLIDGRKKVVIGSSGAHLIFDNHGATFHCSGGFKIKAASFSFEGPDGQSFPLPALPKSQLQVSDQYPSSH